jgi:hypothetical protein
MCNGCMHISYNHAIIFILCLCLVDYLAADWQIPPLLDRGHCHACLSDVKHPKDDAYFGGHSSAGVLSGTYHSHGPKEDLGVTAAQVRMMNYFLASYC